MDTLGSTRGVVLWTKDEEQETEQIEALKGSKSNLKLWQRKTYYCVLWGLRNHMGIAHGLKLDK